MLADLNVAIDQLKGSKGFELLSVIPGSTYRDASTVVVVPTRGQVDTRIVTTWQGLIQPMNQNRAWIFARGHEVGHAYNETISNVLAHPVLSKWKYVLTLEDDNTQPPDAHIRLLETIEGGRFDAVSGLYFTKGDITMPMAYGDPEEYERTGQLNFMPRDVRSAVQNGYVVPVNGIAMGCALWRMELFRELAAPWFVSVADVIDGQPQGFTQDLYFCRNAKLKGKSFAVDCRVRVGHLNVHTGELY
jgi:hypothetical protein